MLHGAKFEGSAGGRPWPFIIMYCGTAATVGDGSAVGTPADCQEDAARPVDETTAAADIDDQEDNAARLPDNATPPT